MKKILICANPDLNLIDGSSVWSQTITRALATIQSTHVDFIARTPPKTSYLFRPLQERSNVRIIDANSLKTPVPESDRKRLSFKTMASLAHKLDETEKYDVIVVRGKDIAFALRDRKDLLKKCWVYLTDIEQDFSKLLPSQRLDLADIAVLSAKILCQSAGFVKLWQQIAPTVPVSKFVLYTPVADAPPENLPALSTRPQCAVYAGKYKHEWKTLDMARLWPKIMDQLPEARLLMMGDKIHAHPEHPSFKQEMMESLQDTPGLDWRGALSREAVQQQYLNARVGLSWRADSLDDTIEYSTKMLEYGAAGCAVVLNRNPLHESLIGTDYPLYANTDKEFVTAVVTALRDEEVAEVAASRMLRVAKAHSFPERVNVLKAWLEDMPAASKTSSSHKAKNKKTILVAGHDLKFFYPLKKALEATGKFDFLVDKWTSHHKHDEERSRKFLSQVDVIFCEWCLGNLVWYSKNKLPDQKLVARFHLQERGLPFIKQVRYENVEKIVFVSDFMKQCLSSRSDVSSEKLACISNYIDAERFKPRKKFGDAAFTLGMIGTVPKRKRLDRAVDLLERLLEKDPRYCLRIKGKTPFDYEWMLNRPEELDYYDAILKRINSNPKLRHKVIFDPPGDDVEKWLALVGFMLSPSDFESFHMVVGESMLCGTCPVIWNWDGAKSLWPDSYVVDSTEEAAKFIESKNEEILLHEAKNLRNYVLNNHDPQQVVEDWVRILDSEEAENMNLKIA